MAFPIGWLETIEQRGLVAPQPTLVPQLDCSEKEFQAAVVDLAKANGWIVHHHQISHRSEPGWPDLVLIRNGKLLIRELKREKKKETPEQLVWLAALRSCGVDSATWRPSNWPDIVKELTR